MQIGRLDSTTPVEAIWMEVSNVALRMLQTVTPPASVPPSTVSIQLKGEFDHLWLQTKVPGDTFKGLQEALEKKRPIYAKIGVDPAATTALTIVEVAIMFNEPPPR